MLVKELRLGVPGEEDLFDKLSGRVLSAEMADRLREMKRFRNVLVHRYGTIDDDTKYMPSSAAVSWTLKISKNRSPVF